MDNFQRNSAGRFPYFLCELGEKTELIGRHIERRGEQKMTLQETIEQIHPLSKEAMDRAKAHWDGIAKPLHSLGKLEDVLIQIAGITGKEEISIEKRALLTFCADNGVVEENVDAERSGSDSDSCGKFSAGEGDSSHSLPRCACGSVSD